jgi:hypothetical protein
VGGITECSNVCPSSDGLHLENVLVKFGEMVFKEGGGGVLYMESNPPNVFKEQHWFDE